MGEESIFKWMLKTGSFSLQDYVFGGRNVPNLTLGPFGGSPAPRSPQIIEGA